MLERNILEPLDPNFSKKIMKFGKAKSEKYEEKSSKTNNTKTVGKENVSEKKCRKVNKKPYKILEAPNLQDDFYLNLVDWSDNNQIAVALDTSLYIWSGCFS